MDIIGIELKKSYFDVAVKNINFQVNQMGLDLNYSPKNAILK